ncbi:prepilin-type N-terminal cleavage/methylation domain-containing protein [Pseudoalteromonas sp. J010]|uniref:PilW family protein n=1 Tax=Pseudoalteromonas sp. J010 TaxID=998465 RepID=UPI000F649BA5|nr:prepilin-type N-terminal cleavage/methylation domain-containing protein [Pseudoalteromonas sp. J010]RRS10086.1 prepilin-type N-terminal cleavage/methylation domain-containing protein [Pseudoalteromonas sp. J010]
MMHHKKGFTLVELLVSVVILLAVITTTSMLYRGAFISSEKATKYVQLSTAITGILDTIRFEIRHAPFEQTSLEGNGTNGGVLYRWDASVIKEKNDSISGSSDIAMKLQTTSNRYKLWQVSLEVEAQGLIRQYQFKEVNWRGR